MEMQQMYDPGTWKSRTS